MENVRLFFNEINKVYDCNLTKIRIGNQHDGGYIALKEICEKTDKVYSFGIGNDIGFEIDFVKRFPLAKIECFDPTIDSLPVYPKNTFSEKLIFKKATTNNLDKISDNSLLKMDIEGCEWDAINLHEMLNIKNLRRFSQILIEIHILHVMPKNTSSVYFDGLYQKFTDTVNNNIFGNYCKAIRSLNHFFYIFHIHPNNSLPKACFGDYMFPPLIELSFVRKDLIASAYDTHTNFPIPALDFSNKIDRGDIFDFYPIGDKIDE